MNTDAAGRTCLPLVILALLAGGCAKAPPGPAAPDAAPAADSAAQPVAVPPTVEQLEAAVPENPLKEAYFGETTCTRRTRSTPTSVARWPASL